jgi:transcription elongation factor Elf1
MVKCPSCGKDFSIEVLQRNGFMCPFCNQNVNVDPILLREYIKKMQELQK